MIFALVWDVGEGCYLIRRKSNFWEHGHQWLTMRLATMTIWVAALLAFLVVGIVALAPEPPEHDQTWYTYQKDLSCLYLVLM